MVGKTHRVGKSLIDVEKAFGTEEDCLAYLEAARWPNGVHCPECDSDKISKFIAMGRTRINKDGETVNSPDRHLYQCMNPKCGYQFTATTGTVFNDTHLPLAQWFMAIGIMCNAKKGVSAKQMERDLGVSYKTAWYLNRRIRKSMDEGTPDDRLTGTVEADETYVGGKFDKRRKRQRWDKTPVFGIIERGGEDKPSRVRAAHVPSPVNRWNVSKEIDAAVSSDAKMMTDESNLYANLQRRGFEHEIVIHSDKEWVRGECHTQGIDGFWSLFKRGLIGSFHQVSIKHLQKYLNEFSFRFNHRENEEIFALVVLGWVIKSAMPYKQLTAKKASSSETAEPDSSDVPF